MCYSLYLFSVSIGVSSSIDGILYIVGVQNLASLTSTLVGDIKSSSGRVLRHARHDVRWEIVWVFAIEVKGLATQCKALLDRRPGSADVQGRWIVIAKRILSCTPFYTLFSEFYTTGSEVRQASNSMPLMIKTVQSPKCQVWYTFDCTYTE